jgi:hypothetical protein
VRKAPREFLCLPPPSSQICVLVPSLKLLAVGLDRFTGLLLIINFFYIGHIFEVGKMVYK